MSFRILFLTLFELTQAPRTSATSAYINLNLPRDFNTYCELRNMPVCIHIITVHELQYQVSTAVAKLYAKLTPVTGINYVGSGFQI